MRKNKGFTLIELLAVIVILGILIAFSTVSVTKMQKKQEVKNRKNVISGILSGAKEYVADHNEILDKPVSERSVTVETLKKDDYVDFDGNKYPDFLYKDGDKRKVLIKKCGDANGVKLKYIFSDNSVTYNDCGCKEQTKVGTSEELCTD